MNSKQTFDKVKQMELKYVFYYFHLEFPSLHGCQYCEMYCHNENIRVTVGKKLFVCICCYSLQ